MSLEGKRYKIRNNSLMLKWTLTLKIVPYAAAAAENMLSQDSYAEPFVRMSEV